MKKSGIIFIEGNRDKAAGVLRNPRDLVEDTSKKFMVDDYTIMGLLFTGRL